MRNERAHNFKDRTGERKGRLTVIALDSVRGKVAYWLCKCDCGAVKAICGGNLRPRGKVVSCGCYRLERTKMPRAARKRKSPKDRAKVELFSSYKKQAKTRGYVFDLTREMFLHLIAMPCYYCGNPPSNYFSRTRFKGMHRYTFRIQYSGIDRVDNDKGYTEENSVACCERCNKGKLTMTLAEFAEWVKLVHSRLSNWGPK